MFESNCSCRRRKSSRVGSIGYEGILGKTIRADGESVGINLKIIVIRKKF